ncbi:MAG: hypothetical protein WA943_07440 [Parvibaculum sp.]|uniref:hypothetical protein n=1 Tax=Parvibaculum sp. TaxID=2024848 RepID=UPI003C733254
MDEGLTLIPTLAIIAVSIAAVALLLFLEKRPQEFGRVRFPLTPFLFLAIMIVIVMSAHLLTLAGAPKHGRY